MQNVEQNVELNGDGGQRQSVDVVEFDLNLWRKQGAQALEFMRRRRSGLQDELQTVERDLDELEGALGERTDPDETAQTAQKSESKVMIRKTIKMLLMTDISNEGIMEEDLIDRVLEQKPGSTAASIRISVQKLCKENSQFVLHEGSFYFVSKMDEVAETSPQVETTTTE